MALESIDKIVEVKIIEVPESKNPPKPRLYQLRRNEQLETSQLSSRLGISTSLYSAYENNPDKIPNSILLKLSDIFNVPVDYIVNDPYTPPKPHLYQLRCRKLLEPYQLASKLGISTRLYNVYEDNPDKIPANILIKLSDIFNVSIDYIVDNSDISTKPEYIKKRIESTLENLKTREQDNIDRIRKAFLNSSPKDIKVARDNIAHEVADKFAKTSEILNELFEPLPYIESELEITTSWKFKIFERMCKNNTLIDKVSKDLKINEDALTQFFNTKQLEEEIHTSMLVPLFRELGISFNLITGEGLCFNELLFRRIAIKGKQLTSQNKILFLKYLKYLRDKKSPQVPIKEDIVIPDEKKTLSKRIEYLRKTIGLKGNRLSQQDLADLIKEHCTGKYKCSLRTDTKIENSDYEDDININYIDIIASLWDISIDYLLGQTNRNIRHTDFLRFYKKFADLPQDKQKLVEDYLGVHTTERSN